MSRPSSIDIFHLIGLIGKGPCATLQLVMKLTHFWEPRGYLTKPINPLANHFIPLSPELSSF